MVFKMLILKVIPYKKKSTPNLQSSDYVFGALMYLCLKQ